MTNPFCINYNAASVIYQLFIYVVARFCSLCPAPFLGQFQIILVIMATGKHSFLEGKSPNLHLFQNYLNYSGLFNLPSEIQDHFFLLWFWLSLYSISEYFKENCHLHHTHSLSSLNMLFSIYSGFSVIFSRKAMHIFC